jgi:hypothetical protein
MWSTVISQTARNRVLLGKVGCDFLKIGHCSGDRRRLDRAGDKRKEAGRGATLPSMGWTTRIVAIVGPARPPQFDGACLLRNDQG